MPTPTPGVWGIDLGQCALKAIRIENNEGQLAATAFDYVEHPKILNQPDADPDQLMREALEKFLSRNTMHGDIVAISVPSQSGLARFVKLPPVEEKKIQDIVRFEAKQQIPFNLDEVVWDYQKIGQGIVTDGFAMETEIGLFAMKRDKVVSYLEQFKEVKVEVHTVQMAPLALCNYVAYDLLQKDPPGADGASEEKPAGGKRRCVVALDIGTDTSNLVITDGERIIWQRPIPLGGNHFTRALTKEPFKLTFAKAEHLKRNATKSGPELKKILTAIKPVLNDFVGEVQRSLGYFTNTHRDAQVEYMIGLGNAFRLPGLQRYLGEKLQMEVRKLSKMERLTGDGVVTAPVFTDNILSFAVAYGLALQGLKLSRLQTNLLPPEIRIERLIRAKKPWAAAAAAAVLLGVGGLLAGKAAQVNAFNDDANPVLKDALTKAAGVADEAKKNKDNFEKTKTDIKKIEDDVKGLTAGERLDWILLNKFVSDALPRPKFNQRGDLVEIVPLTKKARQLYWEPSGDPLAQKAHRDLLKAQRAGKSFRDAARDFLDEQLRLKGGGNARPVEKDNLEAHLIQVSVDALDCRYSKDLDAYWKKFQELNAMKDPDIKGVVRSDPPDWTATGPSGPGWVCELRGHVFHKNNRPFVIDVLIDNLAEAAGIRTDNLPPPAKPGAAPATPATPAPAGTDTAKPAATDKPAGDNPADKDEHPLRRKVNYIALVDITDPTQVVIEGQLTASSMLPYYVLDPESADAGGGGGDAGAPGAPGAPGAAMGGSMPARGEGPGGDMGPGGPGGKFGMGGAPGMNTRWKPLGGQALSQLGGGTLGPQPGGPMPGGPQPGGPPMMSAGAAGKFRGMAGGPAPGGPMSGGPGPGGPAMGSRGGMGPVPGMPPGAPGLGGPGVLPGQTTTRPLGSTLVRTEFVVFFIWKEPTPSEGQIWPEGAPDGPDANQFPFQPPASGGAFPGGFGPGEGPGAGPGGPMPPKFRGRGGMGGGRDS